MSEEMMVSFNFIIELIEKYGIFGVLIIILLLFIHNPDRAIQCKAILSSILFKLFRLGKKTFISSNITYRLNKFFNDDHLHRVFGTKNLNFKIRWVKKSNDPILTQNGSIILNLESSKDQTRNILKATQLSLPLVVCSSLRKSINKDSQDAIDLTLMKKMTEQIGKFAYPVFEKYFLNPSIDGRQELTILYTELVKIDAYGIFIPIFIEEINILSSNFFAQAITEDLSEDIEDLINYLLTIANREIGEEIELNYIRRYFKFGCVLLAKKQKSHDEGATPYLERVTEKLRLGCDRVYLLGFASNTTFFNEVHHLLSTDIRYAVSSITKSKSTGKHGIYEYIEIFNVSKNHERSENHFNELIDYYSIKVGDLVECTALDVLPDIAIFDVNGISGFVYVKDCSWSIRKSCEDCFKKTLEYELTVVSIDSFNERIILTNKQTIDNPVLASSCPKEGDSITVKIIEEKTSCMIGISDTGYEIIIPKDELSWSSFNEYEKFLEIKTKVIIYKIRIEDGLLYGSIRRSLSNPWSNINALYPRGSKISANIHHINDFGIYYLLPNGLIGFLRKEKLSAAEYKEPLLNGKRMEVIVDKVHADKHRIYLSLPEN